MGSFAPFSTLEEVIERANDSLYGLAAGVWSSNINTCMAVAEGVDAGTVWVNGMMSSWGYQAPFGAHPSLALPVESYSTSCAQSPLPSSSTNRDGLAAAVQGARSRRAAGGPTASKGWRSTSSARLSRSTSTTDIGTTCSVLVVVETQI